MSPPLTAMGGVKTGGLGQIYARLLSLKCPFQVTAVSRTLEFEKGKLDIIGNLFQAPGKGKMNANVDVRKFSKSLRSLSKVELDRLCIESGMNDREIQGVLMYIYDRASAEEVADYLNMSLSKFHRRKQILANRLFNFLESIDYELIDMDGLGKGR